MKVYQVKKFYENKENSLCPLTEKLIKSGFQQANKGYIAYAHKLNMIVDYKKALPTQWWHLIKSYCDHRNSEHVFSKNIVCGELIFWMAEVGECVDKDILEKLVNDIIASGTFKKRRNNRLSNVVYNRRKWNMEIQKICFDEIVKVVEADEYCITEMR